MNRDPPTVDAIRRGLTLTAWVCLAGIFLTPLVINPGAYYDAYFSPKWAWLSSLTLLGCAALAGRSLLGVPLRFHLSPIWILALIFLLIHGISILWSRSPSLAAERTLRLGSLTFALWMGLQIVRGRRVLIGLAWLWIGMALVVALWVLKQDFSHAWWPERGGLVSNLPDWRGYLAAGLGNTNHVGDLLALALLPTLVLLGESRRLLPLVFTMIAAVVFAAALTVCFSVGSNLGLIAGAGVMLGLEIRYERTRLFRRRRRWIVLALLWTAMLALYLTDQPLNPHRPSLWSEAFDSERWKEGGPTRLVIWAGGLEMISDHPWIGVGAGNFTYVYPEMQSPLLEGHPELLSYQGSWTNAAHNMLLQTEAELGVAGMMAFLALLAVAFRSLLAGIMLAGRFEFLHRMTLAGLLSAFLAQAMMNFSLQQPSGATALYLLLLGIAVERNSRRRPMRFPPIILGMGWVRPRIEFRTLGRPEAVGLSFHMAGSMGVAGAAILMAVACAALPLLRRPLAAQIEHGRARQSQVQGNSAQEEVHLLRALELNPRAEGCRSRYSQFLVEQNRPKEALEQLEIVRRRLNSNELWQREADAWDQLGEFDKAARARRTYRRLVPRNYERPIDAGRP